MIPWEKLGKSKLKRALIFLYVLIAVHAVAILVTTEIIQKQPDSVQQTINEKFNRIKNELEFKGLAVSMKDLTEDYNDLFDGFSNIIVTDNSGTILFNTNEGYISEKGKFHVLVDPWKANGYGSNIAFLIDSNNNVRYSAQMDIAINTSNLKEASSRNPISKMLFSQNDESFDTFADKEITNSDGTKYTISAEPNIILDYEYIASKGMNLYSLYDSEHQYLNYYLYRNSVKSARHWIYISLIIFLAASGLLLARWVFLDSRGHQMKTSGWTLAALLLNLFGLGIYLISRPKHQKCSSCSKLMDDDWILCPYCGEKRNNKQTE